MRLEQARRTARYAVYAIPGLREEDAAIGRRVREIAEPFLQRTTTARRYGYHATLKAPFRLAGASEAVLERCAAVFAADHSPVMIPSLAIARLGGFWALVPGAEAPALHALADAAVARFDAFRAELTDEEVERRRPERLTQVQRERLVAWGYPFVFDEFRFHITLTDDVGDDPAIGAELTAAFAPVLGADVPVETIALCVEPSPGADLEILSVHPLTGTEAR